MIIGGPKKIVIDGCILNLDPANIKSYIGSGTEFVDLSNEHYNGTLVNGPTFDPTNFGTIQFDGVDDYIILGSTPKLYPTTIDYTWCGWLKFGGATGKFRQIWYGNAFGDTQGFGFALNWSGMFNYMKISIKGTIGNDQLFNYNFDNNLFDQWHFWTFVIIQSTFQIMLYIDSQYITTNQYSDWGSINGVAPVRIGSNNDLYYYDGKIGNIMVYNRALSSAEINQNYLSIKNRYI